VELVLLIATPLVCYQNRPTAQRCRGGADGFCVILETRVTSFASLNHNALCDTHKRKLRDKKNRRTSALRP